MQFRTHHLVTSVALWGAVLVGVVGTTGCARPVTATTDSGGPDATLSTAASQPADVTVQVRFGEVQTRAADTWTAAPDKPGSGLQGLRTQGAGSVLTLERDGQAVARVWLDSDSELGLGQTPAGALVVRPVAGQARLSVYGPEALAVIGDRAVPFPDRDVLVSAHRGGHVVATAHALDAATWTLALGRAEPSQGIGELEVEAESGESTTLSLKDVDVEIRIVGDHAETVIEHVFDNPLDERLEGTFRFAIPEGALVTGLALEIDGKLMEGEFVERNKARKTYESIVDAMQDPALLQWEQGHMFKLRVFPIEPRSTKRVVLRYLAPLVHDGQSWQVRHPTAAAGMQDTIGHFRMRVDGETLVDANDFRPGKTIALAVPHDSTPTATTAEVRDGTTFMAARLNPDWQAVPSPDAAEQARDLIMVVDSSRSALEGWDLARDTVTALLDDLGPHDRFAVLTADLTVRAPAPGLLSPTTDNVGEAKAFLLGVTPDGASDVGAALREAGRRVETGRRTQVVYIGDGVPTWGTTDLATLREGAERDLAGATFHAVTVGRGVDTETMDALTGALGGRRMKPSGLPDVARFALFLQHAPKLRRLRDVSVTVDGARQVVAPTGRTWFEGDNPTVLLRVEPGKPAPSAAVVSAVVAGQRVEQRIELGHARPAPYVARRWAAGRIAQLQRQGEARDEVIRLSEEYGVMSRYTALLVLESEEAYKEHGIERRRAAEAARRISGRDLESVGSRSPALAPDDFQPGDPELHIPAPADARQVVVDFPFGDTKIAVWEPDLQAWTVRFLVPQATAPGRYEIIVRITHADGTHELQKIPYVIDMTSPMVDLTVRRVKGGALEIRAEQRVTSDELLRILPGGVAATDAARARARRRAGAGHYAKVVRDLKRVEVQTPDGQSLRLTKSAPGVFVGRWKPTAEVAREVALQVVATDRALNGRVTTSTVTVGD